MKRTLNDSGMSERNLGWLRNRMSGRTCDFRINESASENVGWNVRRGSWPVLGVRKSVGCSEI